MTKISDQYVLAIVRNITARKTAEAEREALLDQIQSQAQLMQKSWTACPKACFC